jgi:hypothetical protein
VTSLPFTNQVIDPESPDYDLMHTLVAEALLPPTEPTSTPTATASASPGQDSQTATRTPTPSPTIEPDEAADVTAVC